MVILRNNRGQFFLDCIKPVFAARRRNNLFSGDRHRIGVGGANGEDFRVILELFRWQLLLPAE